MPPKVTVHLMRNIETFCQDLNINWLGLILYDEARIENGTRMHPVAICLERRRFEVLMPARPLASIRHGASWKQMIKECKAELTGE